MNTQAQKGFTLIELMIVIAIIGILAAIAIPQYQTYVTKSQVSRVMSETGAYKTAVEDCVNAGKVTGATGSATVCDANGLGLTNSNLLGDATAIQATAATGMASPKVAIDADGSATIEGKFGNNASANLKGDTPKLLHWTRSTAGNWTCTTNVDQKYAPTGCAVGTLTALS